MRICRAIDSRPASIASSLRSFENHAFIFERALGDETKLSQSRLGAALGLLFVTTSTTSPFTRIDSSGTNFPFTFAPTHLSPTSVCTEYAKSTGVDPDGSAITLPFGVKTKTSGVRRSYRKVSKKSPTSSVSCCHSCNCFNHIISGFFVASSPTVANLYFQCAAIPYSARACMSKVLIWISTAFPFGPITVV